MVSKLKRLLGFLLNGFVSLGEGMASVFGLKPQQFSYEERFGTDSQMLASDWQTVSNDLTVAVTQFEESLDYCKECRRGKPQNPELWNKSEAICPRCGSKCCAKCVDCDYGDYKNSPYGM